ncbi:MAG: HlyD family type I secretion periplasmic adaptor subunit [Janthinobacterium lividum]
MAAITLPLTLQAAARLLGKYATAFRHAWRQRHQCGFQRRLGHETQFLPAALSLQETPLSPAPHAAIWMLMGFALLALLWACFGQIDVVATAQGKVVPSDRSKIIQAFDTATVKRIHVSDGQLVKAGETLITLDATATQADHHRLVSELAGARLQIARAQALLLALDRNGAATLLRPAGASDSQYHESQRLLAGQMAEVNARRTSLQAQAVRHEAEMRSIQALERKLEQTLPIASQRASDYKNLVEQNYVSRHGYLEREQARIEQEADLANLRGKLEENAAAIREVASRSQELLAQTRRASLDSITDGQQKAAAFEQELLKAASRDRLMRLVSPVDGTVQQLMAHTVGGVVTPAQTLMTIVPRDDALEVEAFVENKDIGFVRPGQDAEVKIETFRYTRYGTLHANVSSVSHDAINDEKRGLIYSTRVKMHKSTMDIDGTQVSLSPGMAVSVEIKTGKRRVIDYFLAPLITHTSESLRER